MPFVNIYLPVRFTSKVKKDISLAVHESLMANFNVPKNDYFHVIHKVEPKDLIFPDNYLDIPHTNNFIYVHITCSVGRTVEMKKALYAAIAQKISERTAINIADVFIVINETTLANWSFGNGIAQMI